MRINRNAKVIKLEDEADSTYMIARVSNVGEPYRDVVEFEVIDPDYRSLVSIRFTTSEVEQLRDFLSETLSE